MEANRMLPDWSRSVQAKIARPGRWVCRKIGARTLASVPRPVLPGRAARHELPTAGQDPPWHTLGELLPLLSGTPLTLQASTSNRSGLPCLFVLPAPAGGLRPRCL